MTAEDIPCLELSSSEMRLAIGSHVNCPIDVLAAFFETKTLGIYTLLEAARAFWSDPEYGYMTDQYSTSDFVIRKVSFQHDGGVLSQ